MSSRRTTRKNSNSNVKHSASNDSETSSPSTSTAATNTSDTPSYQSMTISPVSSSYVPPTNLYLVAKPFKNPHYKTPKKFKNLKQILAAEKAQLSPLDLPTYSNIEAPPSLIPQKKYCDITGLEARYTDPKTRLRYHSAEVYREIKQLAPSVVQQYLGLRHAAVVLR